MFKVRIIGAGSIGNHLANGFINSGFDVQITDNDPTAIKRMQHDIYPSRYGKWDNRITIISPEDYSNYDTDVLVIGTPPNTHLEIVNQQIERCVPSIILIEKPISHPNMYLMPEIENLCRTKRIRILVGYNHRLTNNTLIASKIIRQKRLGQILSITSQTRESWDGILKAHPWLNGPEDSYLSDYKKGGGALYEHSHALNLLQYFMDISGLGKVVRVNASLDMVETNGNNYDRISFLHIFNEVGNVFQVVQDVVTNPPVKEVVINGSLGQLTWKTTGHLDQVTLYDVNGSLLEEYNFNKNRADDFKPEIEHIKALLSGHLNESPIDYKFALDTMDVIRAAFESNRLKKIINV
jgi:predicted dehydrogenase